MPGGERTEKNKIKVRNQSGNFILSGLSQATQRMFNCRKSVNLLYPVCFLGNMLYIRHFICRRLILFCLHSSLTVALFAISTEFKAGMTHTAEGAQHVDTSMGTLGMA